MGAHPLGKTAEVRAELRHDWTGSSQPLELRQTTAQLALLAWF